MEIYLPRPHNAQIQILSEARRFNVICNGRRWGKTELSKNLTIKTALAGQRLGYWSATYKDLFEVWKELNHTLFPIIKSKNEQVKQIELTTGGIIDFWSMEDPDSGRGRKYHRAIIDEAEKSRNLERAWSGTITPTLTDYRGDSWIFSTPKGTNTYFHKLFKNKERLENWNSWQMPTVTNPYINPLEIEEIKKQLDPITFAQEYMAEFVNIANKPFLYCFEDRHISDAFDYHPEITLHLSFDFNVDPSTCILWQEYEKKIRIIDEIYLNNSNLFEVCDVIKSRYPHAHFFVTGDRTGNARHHTTRGNVNSYTIIKEQLRLKDQQFEVKGVNPPVAETRTLCNAILANGDILIHKRCEKTILDLRFTQVKEDGTIDKTSDAHRSHLLDCFRYLVWLNNRNFLVRFAK